MATPATTPQRERSWAVVAVAVLAWFALWYLTPGLHSRGLGSLFTDDDATSVLIESGAAAVVVMVLVLWHRQENRVLFARNRWTWVYALPAAAAVALPFHYTLALPVGVYLCWMTVSVFWQDYLTFGLLQTYLARRLPSWAVLAVTAVVFWAGHALVLPESFGVTQPLASLAMLALGLVLGGLRMRLRTLHLVLAGHLGFYLVFA